MVYFILLALSKRPAVLSKWPKPAMMTRLCSVITSVSSPISFLLILEFGITKRSFTNYKRGVDTMLISMIAIIWLANVVGTIFNVIEKLIITKLHCPDWLKPRANNIFSSVFFL